MNARPFTSDRESSAIASLLSQHTPPGPSYSDLISEIQSRGFEVYVVGGTVRDIISDKPTNDVDVVTTMLLGLLHPLVRDMYGHPSRLGESAKRNAHLRVGGRSGSGDPFIDICVFKKYAPGCPEAVFGAEFVDDLAHRDFACNALYLDPRNDAIIDPSGIGLEDAETQQLSLALLSLA